MSSDYVVSHHHLITNMSWIMIMYKSGQRICTPINFDQEAGYNFDNNEPNNITEDEESSDNNRPVAATENSEIGDEDEESLDDNADLNESTKGTTATSIYLRDNLEGKGIIEILSLFKKEWFSGKDVDLSLSRLKGPAFILVFFFWLLR